MAPGLDMLAEPRDDMGGGEGGGDDQEAVGCKARDAQVSLDPAALIEELRVDHLADRHAAVGGRDAIQRELGIAPLDENLGEGGLLEEPHRLAHGAVLPGVVLEPVLPSPGVFILRLLPRARIPVGTLPARGFAEAGAGCGEAFVQDAALHSTGADPLPERPVVLIA